MKALLTCCICIVLRGCLGYEISSCGIDGTIDLEATPTSTLTCTGITDDTMVWYLNRFDGSNFTIATCTWSTSSLPKSTNSYGVNRTDFNTSTLVIKGEHTNSIDGTVTCRGNQSNSSSASCQVHVVPPSTITPQTEGTAHTTPNNTMAGGENSNEGDKNRGDEGLPIPIIAGAGGGGLVVIIIIVVIVVVVVKRRGGPSREARNIDKTEDDFEEHINNLYESSDARPYAMTSHLQPTQSTPNQHGVKPRSTSEVGSETDCGYITVQPSARDAVVSTHQHDHVLDADLYSTPNENGAQPTTTTTLAVSPTASPKGVDVYAVVNKPGKTKPQGNPEHQSNEYAVVDKAQIKAAVDGGRMEDGLGHVYAQVDKKAKRV